MGVVVFGVLKVGCWFMGVDVFIGFFCVGIWFGGYIGRCVGWLFFVCGVL